MAIGITERAKKEVTRILEDQNMPDGTALRVGVKGGGCSGFSYTLGFDDEVRPTDQINEEEGDRKSTRLNSSHPSRSRMPSSA